MALMIDYEYRVVQLPRTLSRADARRMLTEEAEYGRWELSRVRLYAGGVRRVWLRRRIIRVQRTS
jgi:hypothetical protein